MKKMLSLVLALALCLTAVTAFAATPSKVAGIINIGIGDDIVNEAPTEKELADAEAELVKLVKEGPAAYFGEDVTEVLDFSPVNVTVPADVAEVEATFYVDTELKAGETVLVLLGVVTADGIVWTSYEGTVNDEGFVVVTIDADVLAAASFCALAK